MKLHKMITQFALISAMFIGVLSLGGIAANAATSNVNTYIQNNYGPDQHSPVKTQISKAFPTKGMRFSAGKPNGVVIHETANEKSNIYDEISYMEKHARNAFVHSFVDNNTIINIASLNNMCWGAGPYANARFMQFEQPRMQSKETFAAQVNNAAWYTAYLLKSHGLYPTPATSKNSGTVWSHHDVSRLLGGTDHTDPDDYWANRGTKYFGQAYDMNQFIQLVQAKYPYVTAPSAGKKTNWYWTKAKRFRLYKKSSMKGIKARYKHKIHVKILKKIYKKNGQKKGWKVQLKGTNKTGYLKAGVHLRLG